MTQNEMEVNVDALKTAIANGTLIQGSWSAGESACLMGWLVDGSQSAHDCTLHGWPLWLVELNVYLFDSCPKVHRDQFALDLALACREAVITEEIAREYVVRVLTRMVDFVGQDPEGTVQNVITTLRSGRWITEDEAKNIVLFASKSTGWSASVRKLVRMSIYSGNSSGPSRISTGAMRLITMDTDPDKEDFGEFSHTENQIQRRDLVSLLRESANV